MGIFKRAFLYVTRKKGKSVLLFCVLLVMATFVLTGLSIEKASKAEQKSLRQALGGEFIIMPEYSEKNPYFRTQNDGEGGFSMYTEYPLTQEILDSVSKINGIERCDASTQTIVLTNLDVFPGNVPVKAELDNSVYARTVSSTEDNAFFQSGIIQLIEGSHITKTESNVAVISKELADRNGLKLGDVISLQNERTAEVKIIGLYEILKPDSPYENIVTYEKMENQIFVDLNTLQNLFQNIPASFFTAIFTIDDPAQLDEIVSEVKNLSTIDWQAFSVTTDNQTYLDAAAPLQKLQTLVTSIIFVIVLVSAIILVLILTMWGRTRIYETGVFLSLGIGKIKIVSQYLAEVLMIAVIAFGCSYFTSNAVANQIANEFLQQNRILTDEDQQNNNMDFDIKEGYGDDIEVSVKNDNELSDMPQQQENIQGVEILSAGTETGVEPLNVTVSLFNMLQLYLIGFVIIIFSVAVSSLAVMRLKPREILSKMS